MSFADPIPNSAPDVIASEGENTSAARNRKRTLSNVAVLGLITFCAYFTATSVAPDPLHKILGNAIAVLATLPALFWIKRTRTSLPVFEVFMLTGLNTYAIPLLGGHEQLTRFDSETLTSAGFMVLAYQIAANITYFSISATSKRGPFWRSEIVSKDISRFLTWGMLLSTAYTIAAQFTNWIPYEFTGVLRAACIGIGNITCFVQSRRWGRNELSTNEKIFFALMVAAQLVFGTASLLLVGGLSLLTLGFLGYISGAKKLPLVPILLALPLVALLHNGKSAMRLQYWGPSGTERHSVTISELPQFYSNWISYGLQPPAEEDATKSRNARLLDRMSLFHIMCLVVSITPEFRPYLEGETYQPIPAQFVPRPLWPGKPSAHISTNMLAVYYGLQSEDETAKTTIGFGLLTEAYANFGLLGCVLLAVAFATLFKLVTSWSADSPILSYPGLLMVVLMAWSFMTEYTLAIWLSSIFQAIVVVMGVPFLTRNLFR